MERVTDEWLREADRKAAELADEQYPTEVAFEPWGDACRLAFAQSIARECAGAVCVECAERIPIYTENTALGPRYVHRREGKQGPGGLICNASAIRARFGLDDETLVQQSKESQK